MENISSYPFLSGYTYASMSSQSICDPGDTEYMKSYSSNFDVNKVFENDLIYVTGYKCRHFFKNIAPKINCNFSVVTAQWDPGADKSFLNILPENLVNWWTINAHLIHDKVKPIPLGLQNIHWKWHGNIQSDPKTYIKFNKFKKSKNILASFSVKNNITERQSALDALEQGNLEFDFRRFSSIDRGNESFVKDYFKKASEYRFILCPAGVGVDTHRLWECLYLGSIPITKNYNVYRDFKDYPIIFLENWSDINDIDLDREFEVKVNQLKKENRIYLDYWKGKML